jgi:predicted TIM-barrel fold metal-dependent hydrolase
MLGERYQLPDAIAQFGGQILDVDGHEVTPINHWRDYFGSACDELIGAIKLSKMIVNAEKAADDEPINAETVWKKKWEQAPGAFDLDRRIDVLDYVGVKRQMMYPGSLGLYAAVLYARAEDKTILKSIDGLDYRRSYAKQLIEIYNDWAVRQEWRSSRVRATAVLVEDSPEEYYETAKRLIGRGIRAFWIMTDRPPGGISPAHPRMDPVWALLADSDTPVLAHVGADGGVFKSMAWREAPAFEGYRHGGEFRLDPWTLSSLHLATQNYLNTIILGGVFERHPRLRFGVAENCAHWVGPLAENMDRFDEHKPFPQDIGEKILTMRPSEYLRRNVRVAPFDIEDVGLYMDRYGLEEVYCFATDFPHSEGGTRPIEKFVASLGEDKPDRLRKFFVENGTWLLPD